MIPPRLAAFATRIGLNGLAIAVLLALCILLAMNTYLDFRLGPVGWEGWKPKAERLQHTVDDIKTAQKQALEAAREAKERAEAEYRDLARNADENAEEARTGALDAAAEYIRTHRLRAEDAYCASSGAVAAPGDRGAGVPAPVPADTFVLVRDADVQACAGAASYAVSAHNWANGLNPAPAP